ncbi:MAG: hypothetical protein U0U70_14735 [Chitinophagaceae bacterium]
MKKIACFTLWVSMLQLHALCTNAQKPGAGKTPPAPAKTTAKPAPVSAAGMNSLSCTIEEQDGRQRGLTITSAPKPVSEKSDYFNTARVDLAHTDADGNKQPVLKLDISDQKNQSLSAAMMVPLINDTGTVVVTYQSNYDNINNWDIHLDGYRLGPQTIIIRITRWAPAGDFIEGTFGGTASLIKENHQYDNDNPPPTVTISKGTFRIRRVKDQTAYGGE